MMYSVGLSFTVLIVLMLLLTRFGVFDVDLNDLIPHQSFRFYR